MENSKFPTCLVISSILATCIYISAAAQSFRRDGAQGINYANFVKNPSNRLNVAVLASLMVYRPVDCTHKCINNQDCYSVNFATTSSLDGTHSCELLSTDKFHKSDDLVPHESFDHFNIKVNVKLFQSCKRPSRLDSASPSGSFPKQRQVIKPRDSWTRLVLVYCSIPSACRNLM